MLPGEEICLNLLNHFTGYLATGIDLYCFGIAVLKYYVGNTVIFKVYSTPMRQHPIIWPLPVDKFLLFLFKRLFKIKHLFRNPRLYDHP